MNADNNHVTSQDDKQNRYCPKCETRVSRNAEVCPNCQEKLFERGFLSSGARIWAYFYGGLIGGIVLAISRATGYFTGSHSIKIDMIIFAIAMIGAWNYKKAQLAVKKDLCFLDDDIDDRYWHDYSQLSNEELLDLKEKMDETEYTEEALEAFNQEIEKRRI